MFRRQIVWVPVLPLLLCSCVTRGRFFTRLYFCVLIFQLGLIKVVPTYSPDVNVKL